MRVNVVGRSESIRKIGFEAYYRAWARDHPGAIAYERLVKYIDFGDEFGEPVPVRKLAELAHTTKTTMLKWLPIYKDENIRQRFSHIKPDI
jgi:hypothetical protein